MGKKITNNQVREQVKKQMAAKYRDLCEQLRKSSAHWSGRYQEATRENFNLRNQLRELQEKHDRVLEENRRLQEWIDRLLEFADLPEEKRRFAVNEYFEQMKQHQENEEMFNSFMKLTSSLFM